MYVKLYTPKSAYRMTLRGIMENGDYISGYQFTGQFNEKTLFLTKISNLLRGCSNVNIQLTFDFSYKSKIYTKSFSIIKVL